MRYASTLMALNLLLAGMSVAHAVDAQSPADPSPASASTMRTLSFSTRPPPPSSRLKYRNGPVCMCSGGLSEADIRGAQKASPVEAPAGDVRSAQEPAR
jgi:hypothetical protein